MIRFPVTGILASAAAAIGGYVLYWYTHLSSDQKAEADELATRYAKQLYGKGLKSLTAAQFQYVEKLVKGELAA